MIKEKMKDFLKVKQELKGEEAIREYSLQIINGEPYEFRLVKGKGIPSIKCRIVISPLVEFGDSDLTWYKLDIGESTYHLNENSLSPEKIIMLINDYLRISKGLLGEGAGGATEAVLSP